MSVIMVLLAERAAGQDVATSNQDRVSSLRRRLADLGLELTAQHPGETDPQLRRWYRVEAPNQSSERRALTVLNGSTLVDAAFVKPQDEPP